MKSHRGQVAIYLAAVLVAICVLAVLNVGIFLSVRARNRAMNACDAAALSVAKYQGELLNRIGRLNVDHLKILLDKGLDDESCHEKIAEIVLTQKRLCFLGPLEGITLGNKAARDNGIKRPADDGMHKILEEHADEIINVYVNNPELYPEPWNGAWVEYVQILEAKLGEETLAGPENPEFADAWSSFPLVFQAFYNAIAGRQWCWFKFNGLWLFDRDSSNMPRPPLDEPTPCWNSEIYPLHLTFRAMGGMDEEMAQSLARNTGYSVQEILACERLSMFTEDWAFFDGRWCRWSSSESEYRDGFNPDTFPIVGEVKPEYDVLGCAAKCRVQTEAEDVLEEDAEAQKVVFTSAAKPFGTLLNAEDKLDTVTVCSKLVLPTFVETKLVPTDSVGGKDLDGGADYAWVKHVREHLKTYFTAGPISGNGCWYCQQLVLWEQSAFRQLGANWLKTHSDECSVGGGSSTMHGGTAHAH